MHDNTTVHGVSTVSRSSGAIRLIGAVVLLAAVLTGCDDPPTTTRQGSEGRVLSSPWFSKKRTKVVAGMRRKSPGAADQIAAPIGTT